MKRLAVLFLAVGFSAGCVGRIRVAGGVETTIQYGGGTLVSTVDPRNGEIAYTGPNEALKTWAIVELDGKEIGVLRDGGFVPVGVEKFGTHTVKATIFVRLKDPDGQVRDRVMGCYRREFDVDPHYRSYNGYNEWWRIEISSNSGSCS